MRGVRGRRPCGVRADPPAGRGALVGCRTVKGLDIGDIRCVEGSVGRSQIGEHHGIPVGAVREPPCSRGPSITRGGIHSRAYCDLGEGLLADDSCHDIGCHAGCDAKLGDRAEAGCCGDITKDRLDGAALQRNNIIY